MNTHQKLGFMVAAVLAVAWLAVLAGGQGWLAMLVAAAAIIAVLTLTTTWKVLFGTLQVITGLVGTVLHLIAEVFDAVSDWAEKRRLALSAVTNGAVPAWDSEDLMVIDDVESLDREAWEDSPGFIESALQRQD